MQQSIMELLWSTSHISGGNAAYVEDLYDQYLVDANSVPDEWRVYFEKLPRIAGVATQDTPHSAIRDHFEEISKKRTQPTLLPGTGSSKLEHESKQVKVLQLISSYRFRGHQKAKLDPLGLMERETVPDLDLAFHNLTQADLDIVFQTSTLFFGKDEATLGEVIENLEATYCDTVGAEFMHITNLAEKQWLQQRFESVRSKPEFNDDVKIHLLERLTAAEGLEKHLDSKYPGTKRFGLEGGESLIPCLDEVVQRSGSYGIKEIVLGMAHRGRLNCLVNILGKVPADLFDEFEGRAVYQTSGDVKYHQGFSSNVMTTGGEIHLAMAFNPSHLEIVSPVVQGSVRARQDRRRDAEGDKVLPIVIHGDAAFAGQGVVMETFQMSQTRAYRTGGTIHIIVNNQVGFTTNKREDSRSTEYCTDVAKMVQAPIFHVNADDPEAVLFVTQVAVDYRFEFQKDVVIDLYCYRRRGHNETDEPSGTQPLMYQVIKSLKTTCALYAKKLINDGLLSEQSVSDMSDEYRSLLDSGKHVVKALVREPDKKLFVDWSPYLKHEWTMPCDTTIEINKLKEIANKICEVPDGIVLQRQVAKIYDDRRKMAGGALAVNWGMAETLAYATLVEQGYPVRLTGQDVGRGTFSHRHAVIHSQRDSATYTPLTNISTEQADFRIHDSLLSELAVLGFEYGYSTTAPGGLVIWEAQFGDFANGAQMIIDQFISSGEHKWERLSGLTMLLPHGYEGQGPEHSSARLERYLQLCAEHNIQVCIPTTPSQVFHMLRRQAIRPLRKPLVVMSPKWLLRHPLAVSTLDELAEGSFQNVISEQDAQIEPANVKRIIMCAGKVYYHLLEARRANEQTDVAIVRLEQLYPFPEEDLLKVLSVFENISDVVWVQEEPLNQGAWYSSQHHMRRVLHRMNPRLYLNHLGRDASAAAAAGYMALHLQQQEKLMEEALRVN